MNIRSVSNKMSPFFQRLSKAWWWRRTQAAWWTGRTSWSPATTSSHGTPRAVSRSGWNGESMFSHFSTSFDSWMFPPYEWLSIAEEYSLFTSLNPVLRFYSLRKSLHVSKSWRNHLIVFWPAVRDLIVNCLFYRDRWAFSCGQARLLTKEKFLCSDAEHKSYRKCWQEKKNQIFYKQVPSYLSLYHLM